MFTETNINITKSGRKYLGSFVGTAAAKDNYVRELVEKWITKLKTLCKIAKSEPQAAYAGFVSGFRHKITYHLRVMPNISEFLQPLDKVIDDTFIPAITEGHYCSKDERLLLSLPVKLGGLGIPIFSQLSKTEYQN